MHRALRIVVVIALVLMGIVVATGVRLVFRHRPEPSSTWAWIRPSGAESHQAARRIHRLASLALVPVSLAVVVLAIVDRYRIRAGRVVAALVAVPLLAATVFTGLLLPWDQLALNAVQVGADVSGYLWLWRGPDVRFVLVGGSAVSPSTIAWKLVAHLALGVAVGAALVWLLVRPRRPGEAETVPAPTEAVMFEP